MNDDLLIQRYLDGKLTNDELAAFQQRLREDAAMREHLRLIAEHAVAFGDMVRRETDTPVCSSIKSPDRSVWFTTLALAACITLLATSAWLFIASKPSAVFTLVDSTGTVTWSDGEPIAPGESLPAGTLETVGEASSAQFRFADGTLITLQGGSELAYSEDEQKLLALSRGSLSAVVQKQPAGRPMLIRTPSAVAEVVGTAFDLSARTEDTLLKVDEGLVKLKRLVDGSQIDVPANRSAVASLNAAAALDAASTPEPLTAWSFDFTTTVPPRDWRGIAEDGIMHASPYVAKKLPDGSIITHHGISIRTAMLPQPQRLLATDTSVIRWRFRSSNPKGIHCMLLTHLPDGRFGGNFEAELPADQTQADAEGWREVDLPIETFHSLTPHHPKPAGHILTSVILFTPLTEAELSASEFSIRTAR